MEAYFYETKASKTFSMAYMQTGLQYKIQYCNRAMMANTRATNHIHSFIMSTTSLAQFLLIANTTILFARAAMPIYVKLSVDRPPSHIVSQGSHAHLLSVDISLSRKLIT